MARPKGSIEVYLEVAPKRTFAAAVDWPGWCRSGRDEASALEALVAYGRRYRQALSGSRLGFRPPADTSAFLVVERLRGGAGTEFGAPEAHPSGDQKPLAGKDLSRARTLLRACWRAFDAAAVKAKGRTLRKGPRGGGRSLRKMMDHVVESEAGYLTALGWKPHPVAGGSIQRVRQIRQTILEGLEAASRGEIAPRGPRGGVRWPARYFVRRLAWHVLDHAWELEDRIL
jgi:hypothetical protein